MTILRQWSQTQATVPNYFEKQPNGLLVGPKGCIKTPKAILSHSVSYNWKVFQSPANSKPELASRPLCLRRPFVDIFPIVSLVFPADCFLIGFHKGLRFFSICQDPQSTISHQPQKGLKLPLGGRLRKTQDSLDSF